MCVCIYTYITYINTRKYIYIYIDIIIINIYMNVHRQKHRNSSEYKKCIKVDHFRLYLN